MGRYGARFASVDRIEGGRLAMDAGGSRMTPGGEGAGRAPPGADHRQKCSLTPPPTSSGTSIAPL